MSETTNYFAVKANAPTEVRQRLKAANIEAIVDADEADYWFLPASRRGGAIRWVAVSAPAQAGFSDAGVFCYADRFPALAALFPTLLHFRQPGGAAGWWLKVQMAETLLEKEIAPSGDTIFTESEANFLSACFEMPFAQMLPLLQAGKGGEFLNLVGIPFLEMNNQDMVRGAGG